MMAIWFCLAVSEQDVSQQTGGPLQQRRQSCKGMNQISLLSLHGFPFVVGFEQR